MQRSLFVLLFILSIHFSYAQVSSINPVFLSNSEKINFTAADLQALGRVFYDDNWNAGNIHLKSGDTLRAYYMRYDLVKNQLEVIINENLKAIRKYQINGFEWFSPQRLKHEKFIYIDLYELITEKPNIIQLLTDGEYQLIKAKEIFAKHKTSAPSLITDYSSNESKVEIIEKYYYLHDNELIEIKRSDRKNQRLIDNEKLNNYINVNNLSFDKEPELIKIFEFLNRQI